MIRGNDLPMSAPALPAPPASAASGVIAGANPYGAAIGGATDVLKSALSSPPASSGSDGSISDRSANNRISTSTRQRNVNRAVNFGTQGDGVMGATQTPSVSARAEGGDGGDSRGGKAGPASAVPIWVWILAAAGLAAAFIFKRN